MKRDANDDGRESQLETFESIKKFIFVLFSIAKMFLWM